MTKQQLQDRSSDKSSSDCNNENSVSNREVVGGLIVTARPFTSKTHILCPKNWITKKCEAVLDNDRNGLKITGIVKPFGNTGHLTGAPKEWANKRVFVKIICNNKNKSKSSRSDKHDK